MTDKAGHDSQWDTRLWNKHSLVSRSILLCGSWRREGAIAFITLPLRADSRTVSRTRMTLMAT